MRVPLNQMRKNPNCLWDPTELGASRRRVAAVRFLVKNTTLDVVGLNSVSAQGLAQLCKLILQEGRKSWKRIRTQSNGY